jgi:branched-chain amino acid transport system substrate-binding protein
VIQNVSSPAAQVARDLQAQGLDMRIVCLNWCADELFIETAGDAAEGHIMVQPFAPPNSGVPGLEDIETFLSEQGSSLQEEGLHYAQGWYTMHVMAEGIATALADGDLSGAAIREALETMGPVDTGGVIGEGAVEFSGDSHRGSSSTGIYDVQGGQLVELETGVTP